MTTIVRRGALAGITALLAAAVVALAFGEESAARSQLVDPNPGDQELPVVAFDGQNYLAVWQDNQSGLIDITGTRVAPSGAVLDENGLGVSRAPGAQRAPSIGFGAAQYLVTWSDFRSGGESAGYAARVNPAGTVLDPSGIHIASSSTGRIYPRGVAFDGTNFLVPWWSAYVFSPGYEGISALRVTPGGAVLFPSIGLTYSMTTATRVPVVAFGQSVYLVAWWDNRAYSDIYGARVTPAGGLVDPLGGFPIAQGPDSQIWPAMTFGGGQFFVTWDYRAVGSGNGDVYGARLTENGAVLDPSGIPIATGPHDQRTSAVAFDGTNYLVVWTDGTESGDIYCARVAPDGTVLDTAGIPVSTAAGDQRAPAIAFDGVNFLIVWQDKRNGDWDVYGSRVTPAGQVLDPAGILISTKPSAPPPPPPPDPPPAPPPPPPTEPPPPPRCIVPRVVGLRLSLAARKIRRAHCTVGGVRRKRSARAGIVLSQKPRARAIRRRGFPVTLVVGRR
jgi:large repetitive protein